MFYDHDKAMEEIQQPREGWKAGFDKYTTEDAPNSIPGGMPIVSNSDPTFSGKVLGSMQQGNDIMYYIEWDKCPKMAYIYWGSQEAFRIAC